MANAEPEAPALRVATYNTSLHDDADGGLVRRLAAGDERARQVAAVIQSVRPDLVLLNEFDWDEGGEAIARFTRDYLGVGQHGQEAIAFPYHYAAPVNTGVPSGLDLDGDGRSEGPDDAWGYGRHPGQYGMLVLSRHPIDAARVRSFQHFRWAQMPGALRPLREDGTPWYCDPVWRELRLSSKSHWDVPVRTPQANCISWSRIRRRRCSMVRKTATGGATTTRSGCGPTTSTRRAATTWSTMPAGAAASAPTRGS